MWIFIIAGALYLVGVAAILLWRPRLMFAPDGQWKEFGLGQNSDKYTPFPFWLFCLVWAIVSYTLTLLGSKFFGSGTGAGANRIVNMTELENGEGGLSMEDMEFEAPRRNGNGKLPKGYYVLNRKATKLKGVPQYVYLGEQMP